MNIGLPQPEIVRSDTRRVVNLNLPEPVVIVSTLFAFGGVVTSAWKLTAVSALILIIIGFARGWAKVSLSRVELSREVAQHRLYVGETTSLELILENRKTCHCRGYAWISRSRTAWRSAAVRILVRRGRTTNSPRVFLRPSASAHANAYARNGRCWPLVAAAIDSVRHICKVAICLVSTRPRRLPRRTRRRLLSFPRRARCPGFACPTRRQTELDLVVRCCTKTARARRVPGRTSQATLSNAWIGKPRRAANSPWCVSSTPVVDIASWSPWTRVPLTTTGATRCNCWRLRLPRRFQSACFVWIGGIRSGS